MVKNSIHKTSILLLLLILLGACNEKPAKKVDLDNREPLETVLQSEIINIGVAAMLSPKEALLVYNEIVEYIGKQMGVKTKMIFSENYARMNKKLENREVLAAFVCSGPYVDANDEWGMELIAAPVIRGEAAYYSYLITHKNSILNSLANIKGKSFAFTDPISNTGKIVPTYELAKLGFTPENYFSSYIYTGSHDKSIEAVSDGQVDAAAVDNLIYHYYQTHNPKLTQNTKVIGEFGPFCSPPFVMHPDTDQFLKIEMQNILLKMHLNVEGRIILNKLSIDKFQIVSNSCYQSIREMNKYIKTLK